MIKFLNILQFYWKNKQTQKIRINFQNLLKFIENPKQSVHLRSSCWHIFFKIGVFKNFANFRGKHLCWSLFLIPATLLKRLQHRCFPVKLAKFLRISFFTEHLRWLFLSLLPFMYLGPC